MRVIELGSGRVKITPCKVSETDHRQALIFEPVAEPHEIGVLTGEIPGPYTPKPEDTLIILGSLQAANVLRDSLDAAMDAMREAMASYG